VTQIPPGWHPDPAGPTPGQPPLLRYWDGVAWTQHVAPAQQPVQLFTGPPAERRGPTTPDGEPLSGWWWRVLAYVMDSVAVGIVANIVSLPAQVDMQRDLQTLGDDLQRRIDADPNDPGLSQFFDGVADVFRDHALGLLLPALLVTVAYHCALLRWKGATLGKLAVGLRVRPREAAGRLPWTAVAIRVLVQFVIVNLLMMIAYASGSLAVLAGLILVGVVFFLLDVLWPLWDRRHQALHDKAAGTYVVRPPR
jgi:uncharacterized RDD family membrane protein YckC